MNTSQSVGFLNLELDPVNKPGHLTIIRYDQFVGRLMKAMATPEMDKAHAVMGVCGEAGELCDGIKKEIIYGKPADRDNIVEELGDLRFYMQAIQNIYGITETEVLQANGYKLAKRYAGMAYSDEAAIARADKQESEPKYVHRAWDERLGQWVMRPGKEPGTEAT